MYAYDRPYYNCAVAEQFKEHGKIAIFDIDHTLTFTPGDQSGIAAIELIRSTLKGKRIPFVQCSARAPEMCMDEPHFEASRLLGLKRQPAKRGPRSEDGALTYVPLETVEEFRPFLNPDAFLGFGCGPFLLHGNGYMPDATYDQQLGYLNGYFWRSTMFRLMEKLRNEDAMQAMMELQIDFVIPPEFLELDLRKFMPPLENELSYVKGLSDVEPLPFRIQFDFAAESDLHRDRVKAMVQYQMAKELLKGQLRRYGKLDTACFVDESKPDDHQYTFYLMPHRSSKVSLINHFVYQLCNETGRDPADVDLEVNGDSLTDVPCCDAVPEARMHFVLAGKSRLGPYLTPGCNLPFADDDLSWIRKRLKQLGPWGRFYVANDNDTEANHRRTFVICDLAYPGLGAPQSVAHEVTEWVSVH